MRVIVVALALSLGACSGTPAGPPVTASRVLEISGLEPVVNAMALSPDGGLLRSSTSISSGLESMAPVSLALTRAGQRAAANGIHGRVYVVDTAKASEERSFANVAQAPGHGMHAEMRYSLAFTEDGDWLFAPDMHDRGLRILHVPSGKSYPVLTGEGPFYKAVALVVPASLVGFLRPGDDQGRGPYGLEVWRLSYARRPR